MLKVKYLAEEWSFVWKSLFSFFFLCSLLFLPLFRANTDLLKNSVSLKQQKKKKRQFIFFFWATMKAPSNGFHPNPAEGTTLLIILKLSGFGVHQSFCISSLQKLDSIMELVSRKAQIEFVSLYLIQWLLLHKCRKFFD